MVPHGSHSVAWHASRERYVVLFDPQIVRAFRNPWHYSLDLWKYWTSIEVPILVLRGVKSDMLPSGTWRWRWFGETHEHEFTKLRVADMHPRL